MLIQLRKIAPSPPFVKAWWKFMFGRIGLRSLTVKSAGITVSIQSGGLWVMKIGRQLERAPTLVDVGADPGRDPSCAGADAECFS